MYALYYPDTPCTYIGDRHGMSGLYMCSFYDVLLLLLSVSGSGNSPVGSDGYRWSLVGVGPTPSSGPAKSHLARRDLVDS